MRIFFIKIQVPIFAEITFNYGMAQRSADLDIINNSYGT